MLKLQTLVSAGRSSCELSYSEKTLFIGSCFSDSVGQKALEAGLPVMLNPFGTLYNPLSIANSLSRLSSGVPFTEEDCIQMGSGSELVCSFSHHTSFARPSAQEFLSNANETLGKACAFFRECGLVVVTLGTAWCYKREGEVVSNCLKRDASEFSRERLSVPSAIAVLSRMVERYPEKKFIFTVSPIRHLRDGAHGNMVSKSTLILAVDALLEAFPGRVEYFPAYEIVMDELRDYRFYAEDMLHPSSQTVSYLWERFTSFALREGEEDTLAQMEKAFRQSRHRPMH